MLTRIRLSRAPFLLRRLSNRTFFLALLLGLVLGFGHFKYASGFEAAAERHYLRLFSYQLLLCIPLGAVFGVIQMAFLVRELPRGPIVPGASMHLNVRKLNGGTIHVYWGKEEFLVVRRGESFLDIPYCTLSRVSDGTHEFTKSWSGEWEITEARGGLEGTS
jgi:hypothetical protein